MDSEEKPTNEKKIEEDGGVYSEILSDSEDEWNDDVVLDLHSERPSVSENVDIG